MTTLYINGKFTAQRTTGVQRMAHGNVQALDAEIAAGATPGVRWVLLCPPGAVPPPLRAIEVRVGGPRRGGLHAWEQFWLPLASLGGGLLCLSGSTPVLKLRQVFTIHDTAILDWPDAYTRGFRRWYGGVWNWLGRRALGVLTVSEFSRQRILDHLGLAPGRVAVSHLGSEHFDAIAEDSAGWAALGLGDAPYLLSVASQNPTKNLPALLEAFAGLPHAHARLVLVGGGSGSVFAAQSHDAGDPRILRVGAVSDGVLKALYRRATALVFPSLYEGFGLPPVEAMTCGCPVLAARAASIPEVCGDAAHYFDPADLADMRRALADALDGRLPRERLLANARRRVAELNWPASARRLLAACRAFHLLTEQNP